MANEQQRELNKQNALAIDLGINNLATCVCSNGKSFIIDGKKLKSINQWYNKENARLQSIKDKQGINGITRKQFRLANKRNNRVNDYLSETARNIISYCLINNIGILVVGHNNDFQRNTNIGKANNQTFTNVPFAKLIHKLTYLCEMYGIQLVEQEESYTSKASFFDNDAIPVFNDNSKHHFSGKRIKRGLYRTSNGMTLNADVNAALNILKKSNVVSLEGLYSRGAVDTPSRIKIA